MTSLVATKEALDRFSEELPVAGIDPDRLRRQTQATRALITQALSVERPATDWIDHNLAILVVGGMASDVMRHASLTLFRGIRRRLRQALVHDPDDLSLALALALGGARSTEDPQLDEEAPLVLKALQKPQAGPRLLNAALDLVLRSSRKKDSVVASWIQTEDSVLDGLASGLKKRLPQHPGVALDEIRLNLLRARAAQTDTRVALLESCRADLGDFEKRFGASQASRRLRADVLDLRARSPKAGPELLADAMALFEQGFATHSLTPKTATRLVRAVFRAKLLSAEKASDLHARIRAYAGDKTGPWRDAIALLLEQGGDTAGLTTLWEESLLADAKDRAAAAGLADTLRSNLRANLKAPFDNRVLDKVLDAVSPGALAKWSASDLEGLFALITEAFGNDRLLTFLEDSVLKTREHKKKKVLWDKALSLTDDGPRRLSLARRAVNDGQHAEARLILVKHAIETGEGLGDAEGWLKPLLQAKGAIASEAQALQRKLARHPDVSRSHLDRLLAFEHELGVGTDKIFKLKVVYTSAKYVLVDLIARPAPAFYEHKYLRTMLRDKDLPDGVSAIQLKKGDHVMAPVRGQNADPKKDKGGLRVYWITDPSRVTLELDAEALAARSAAEEAAWGVGTGRHVALRVGFDNRKKRLWGKFDRKDASGTIRIAADQLPDGTKTEGLGKGKRFWGVVVRSDAGSGFSVEGALLVKNPDAEKEASKESAPTEPAAEAPSDIPSEEGADVSSQKPAEPAEEAPPETPEDAPSDDQADKAE